MWLQLTHRDGLCSVSIYSLESNEIISIKRLSTSSFEHVINNCLILFVLIILVFRREIGYSIE